MLPMTMLEACPADVFDKRQSTNLHCDATRRSQLVGIDCMTTQFIQPVLEVVTEFADVKRDCRAFCALVCFIRFQIQFHILRWNLLETLHRFLIRKAMVHHMFVFFV